MDENGALSLLHSRSFSQLRREKKRWILPHLLLVIVFYFGLPLSVSFFPALMAQASPFLKLPWGWVYAFLQFMMTFVLGWLYWKKAKHFDRLVEQIKGDA